MKENKTKPDIRFKGFTDDWEQRKLRDEAIEILAGGDINKEKTVENGKYPIYANALHQRELEILKNLKKTCLKRMFI